jgi:DNA repair exonuclease SbcCD ATPase subunit
MSSDTTATAERRPETQDLNNVLTHIKNLEQQKQELEKRLQETEERAARMSQKTKAAMQSAMDTLMKKWMDAVETKDDTVKQQFKTGLDTLINKSADENGVWQMMVAASALHERQEHNLEKLRLENNELRGRVDSSFATQESRTGSKRKAEAELGPGDVTQVKDMWADFACDIGRNF